MAKLAKDGKPKKKPRSTHPKHAAIKAAGAQIEHAKLGMMRSMRRRAQQAGAGDAREGGSVCPPTTAPFALISSTMHSTPLWRASARYTAVHTLCMQAEWSDTTMHLDKHSRSRAAPSTLTRPDEGCPGVRDPISYGDAKRQARTGSSGAGPAADKLPCRGDASQRKTGTLEERPAGKDPRMVRLARRSFLAHTTVHPAIC